MLADGCCATQRCCCVPSSRTLDVWYLKFEEALGTSNHARSADLTPKTFANARAAVASAVNGPKSLP